MIGIGVTSYKRGYLLENFINSIEQFTTLDYHLHVAKDIDNIAKAKNHCLEALKDTDHVFLFDDDCYPISAGWDDFILHAHYVTGEHHFLYLNDSHIKLNTKYCISANYSTYRECGGVFMSFTRKALNKVGYFNPNYKKYGFEHAGISNRIYKAGLNSSPYLSLDSTKLFIKSLDYEQSIGSSLSSDEKNHFIKQNRPIFIDEITSDKIYYENTI